VFDAPGVAALFPQDGANLKRVLLFSLSRKLAESCREFADRLDEILQLWVFLLFIKKTYAFTQNRRSIYFTEPNSITASSASQQYLKLINVEILACNILLCNSFICIILDHCITKINLSASIPAGIYLLNQAYSENLRATIACGFVREGQKRRVSFELQDLILCKGRKRKNSGGLFGSDKGRNAFFFFKLCCHFLRIFKTSVFADTHPVDHTLVGDRNLHNMRLIALGCKGA
jgi:hypothetical protein